MVLAIRTCPICQEDFPRTEEFFHRQTKSSDGLFSYCKTCNTQRTREWCERNAEKKRAVDKAYREANRERTRDYGLRRNFNISLEDFEKMLAEQGGGCAICGGLSSRHGGTLHVDHDHTTGKVRGLLCDGCNLGLGKFLDNSTLLDIASSYLSS